MTEICRICGATALPLDVVDFNKSCEEWRGKHLPLCGIPIYYFLCDQCGFCFAPEFSNWKREDFAARIYNANYEDIDPDYFEARPRANAAQLNSFWGERRSEIRHLDYGGGKGKLRDLMRESGWQSESFDPFVDADVPLSDLGKFNLVTAFEVIEHVLEPKRFMADLKSLLTDEAIVLFSTLLSDGQLHRQKRLTWWYAAPRNGHISLLSKRSLILLARQTGFKCGTFSPNLHVCWQTVPEWAKNLFPES